MEKHILKEYVEEHEKNFSNKGFGTKAIHSGQEPDIVNGCLSVPINLSSTYKQHTPSVPYGNFDYSRCGNPTRENLERLISSIENGKYSIAFASGCAVTSTCIQLVKTGEHVICIDDVYGGTQRIFRKICGPNYGIDFSFIPMDDMELVKKTLTPKTRMIWVESPTNPTLKLTDIALLVKTVKDYDKDIIIICDNTFLSPYNFKPLDFGCDCVMESATKYLGGHSDLVMGVFSTNNKDIYDRVYFACKSFGGVPSPFDCYMLIRGIKTLHLRMERTNSSALAIAKYLEKHKNVEAVYYCGLESSKYYEISKKQQKGNGGVISFNMKSDLEGSIKFLKSLKIFALAESLGAVESLAEHPATMTHASVPPEIRLELGITDSFIRLSVGCEDLEDLIEDLDQAFKVSCK